MKFGEFPLDEAVGGVLAHSLVLGDGKRLRKGLLITTDYADTMRQAGLGSVVVAMPEPGDVLEDDAAAAIARNFTGYGLRLDDARTGRVNFYADANGILRVNKGMIDAINRIDPGIAFSTLPDFAEVNEGRMIATVKIIPYAIAHTALDQINDFNPGDAISVLPYQSRKIGLIFTEVAATKPSVLDKTRKVLERRLALSEAKIVSERRINHGVLETSTAVQELAQSSDLVILFGASAISDRNDVIPAAVEMAGGTIIRFGMPVDPGNLLLLAEHAGTPVVGAPGCARSPAENGFDWVLQRLLADIPISSDDLSEFGVGGLLMETGARPHPREDNRKNKGKSVAVVLAGGQSRRMGAENKMTVPVHGKAMVRHVVEAALSSSIEEVLVVTGHAPEEVKSALDGLSARFVHNADYIDGLSSSLRCGIGAAREGDFDCALVLLGDMPFISPEMLNKMNSAFAGDPSKILLATAHGKRGNPVLWPARFFDELMQIKGDVGARHIIGQHDDFVMEIELGEAAGIDLDTPDALSTFSEN